MKSKKRRALDLKVEKTKSEKLFEIAQYFLKMGLTGFGGPLVLVAQMQRDLVFQREWYSKEAFPPIFGLIKAMPGPVGFQTAVFLAGQYAGFWGSLIAGMGLVLPSFLLILIIAAGYGEIQNLGALQLLVKGMGVAALAVILSSVKALSGQLWKDKVFWILALLNGFVFIFTNIPEPILILASGGIWAMLQLKLRSAKLTLALTPVIYFSDQLIDLVKVAFKAGAFVFGTGIAIIPLLEKDVVSTYHWLSAPEFIDALAFGQITPGPVMISLAFVGFKVSGVVGAFAATVAVFLPSFVHMTTWFPKTVNWLLKQKWIDAFAKGALSAVIGTIIIVLGRLLTAGISDYKSGLIFLLAMGLLISKKFSPWVVILGAAPFAGLLSLI
jgi:chromate transporter